MTRRFWKRGERHGPFIPRRSGPRWIDPPAAAAKTRRSSHTCRTGASIVRRPILRTRRAPARASAPLFSGFSPLLCEVRVILPSGCLCKYFPFFPFLGGGGVFLSGCVGGGGGFPFFWRGGRGVFFFSFFFFLFFFPVGHGSILIRFHQTELPHALRHLCYTMKTPSVPDQGTGTAVMKKLCRLAGQVWPKTWPARAGGAGVAEDSGDHSARMTILRSLSPGPYAETRSNASLLLPSMQELYESLDSAPIPLCRPIPGAL